MINLPPDTKFTSMDTIYNSEDWPCGVECSRGHIFPITEENLKPIRVGTRYRSRITVAKCPECGALDYNPEEDN